MPSSSSLAPCKAVRAAAWFLLLAAALVLSAGACFGGAPPDKDLLIGMTDEVVIPAYGELADTSAELDSKAAVF